MQYKQFEDLPVWRKAVELAVRIHGLGSSGCLKGYSGLRDQTRTGRTFDLKQYR